MQIRFFTLPLLGSEAVNEELNAFLRSKKVLQVENHLVQDANGSCWAVCVKYIEGGAAMKERIKVDYKVVLGELKFQRFARLKEWRLKVSKEEGVPAYSIFTDDELAEVAKLNPLSMESIATVTGIGPSRIDKYGERILELFIHETSGQPAK